MNKLRWAALIFLGLLTSLFAANWIDSYAQRYLHFKALTRQTLIDEADKYVRERTIDHGQYACLYVVTCETGKARLKRADDIRNLDVAALKKTIWKRRMESTFCQGRTTNIGLRLIPQKGHADEIEALALARWSFYNDRFIPRSGRFQSGSFSEVSWEACTPEASLNTQLKTFHSAKP